ncbi:pleckstrin homology domain-containing family J member 1 [Acanthochromis polyacanthus]|uniref:pleckstrin homology domain-containing family J member 1 n=1 Tax=Acanthochromis polyacanthus TaxID=80966 RepID=UPI002234C139|nr:pleckstrin homology domain-containing family J member 1 [Acanthochromis polyacanthus]
MSCLVSGKRVDRSHSVPSLSASKRCVSASVMRFQREGAVSLSRQPSEMAAELGMKGPKKGDGKAVCKERLVKLVVNFLFYFRTDEEEVTIGALLLEQCRVEREDSQTFSIAFLDEAERKYLFECDSEEQCGEWVDSIIKASYEFMRKNLIFYRTEIHRLTGKDPLEQYGISDETRFQVSNGLQLMPRDTSSL